MENLEREINLKNSSLNLKLTSYTPEDVNEFDVGEKIYLKRFEEIDKIHGELANLINSFAIEFPKADRNQFYGDMLLKSCHAAKIYCQLFQATHFGQSHPSEEKQELQHHSPHYHLKAN